VLAGTQPISGATVQLYAAGLTGNGVAATALFSTPLTTDATGAFTFPTTYTCPAATSQVYLIATGGKVGSSTTPNPYITLLAPIGACSSITASTQFTLNEVTTVVSAWALSQFLSAGGNSGNIGAFATNAQGLANAFATATSLVNNSTGAVPGATFPSTGTAPAARINTLANLLNTCIVAATANSCSQLFSATTPASGTTPTNTLDAVLNLVRSPGTNVATLYTQAATSSAFSPPLAKAPADWTLFINYTGAGLNGPTGLGIDSVGNVWVSNYYALPSKFSPTGAPLFSGGTPSAGLTNSYSIAIDLQNNAWVPYESSDSSVNKGLGSVAVFNSAGQSIAGTSGYSAGGLLYPIAIAFDTKGTAWIVDYGNSHITLLSPTGQPLSGATGYTASSFAFPVAIAIDANQDAWIANLGDTTLTNLSADGTKSSFVSCCNAPAGLAIDQKGYIWAANYYGDSVSQISSSGAVISSGYTGGGLVHPQGLAIDGAGNVWVANYRSDPNTHLTSLTELAGSNASAPGKVLSPASGWGTDAGLLEAFALAVDASGNLWVTNFGSNTLTQFVGVAPPVKTPLLGLPQAP
jgi:hypothetical protein